MVKLSRIFLAAAALVPLVSCAVTQQGVLSDAKNQRTIPITVVIVRDSASVSGTDPVTGERYSGLLVPDDEQRRPHSDFGGVAPPMGGGSGSGPGGTAPVGIGASSPTVLNLVGTLEGDQGTRLRCAVELQQRLRLTGEGVCRSMSADSDARFVVRF